MEVRYFDNSATTRIKEEVLTEMFPYLSREYGNPSSLYSIGRKSKRAIEEARKRVASLINCKPEEIYFTSCGSESDNTALKGIAYANQNKGKHIITSKIEHPAILHSCQNLENKGFEVTYLDVDKDGFVNLETLEHSIRTDTILISIMFANNEIGTIEPIEEIAKIAHKNGIIFHTDAVQACGNIPIDVQKLDIDMLSLSGHKIYAPKGIGALYVKKGIEFERFMDGGHQEKNKRSGTENVAEIVALGKACKIAEKNMEKYQNKLQNLRNYCLEKMKKSLLISILTAVIVMAYATFANAATTATLADELYSKGSKYGMTSADKVKIERYLSENTVTDEQANAIVAKADEAIAVMEAAGTTDYSKLTDAQKDKLKSIANSAAAIIDVKLVFKKNTVEIYDNAGKLIETIGQNNGKLAYTGNNVNVVLTTSVIAIIALAITVATKRNSNEK